MVVQVGADGISDGVISAADQALDDHELIKVKIGDGPADRHEASAALATATKAELAQLLGYRDTSALGKGLRRLGLRARDE